MTLNVIEGDFQRDEDGPVGELYCTACNSHSFRLTFDANYECYNVQCSNCREVFDFLAWASSVDLGPDGTVDA
jgi:hypothetical protein